MAIVNIEFKAAVASPGLLEKRLLERQPYFKGEDHQTDTYFNVPAGRLKLREGKIENALIWYERQDIAGTKRSDILLYRHRPDPSLKAILEKLHGIKVVVAKKRRIYFIDNIKFHFDTVDGLGSFIEVEAIDENGDIGIEKLKQQCHEYISYFGILPSGYIGHSYSDLLLAKQP